MDTLEFIPQTDCISQALVVGTLNPLKQGLLKGLYNEAQAAGKDLVVKTVTLEGAPNYLVRFITIGVGVDPSQTGILLDTAFLTFFSANRLYTYIILKNKTANAVDVSGGITPGGTELFNAETIAANGTKPILISLSTTAVTPLYLTSANWNSSSIDISTLSDPI